MASLEDLGLPKKKTKAMLADLQNAGAQFESLVSSGALDGLSPSALRDMGNQMKASQVLQGMSNRVSQANSSNAPRKPGATHESEAIHLQSKADIVLNENYIKKIPLSKPDDSVNSAIKGMQILSDNLSKDINKSLASFGSYVDAVSNPSTNIESLIGGAADQMSSYQKVITGKMMEFTTKKLNAEMGSIVAALPSSERSKFGDLQSIATSKLLEGFNGIAGKQAGLLRSVLSKAISRGGGASSISELVSNAKEAASIPTPALRTVVNSDGTVTISPGITTVTYPQVPMCAAEDIIGEVLSASREEITELNNNIVGGIGSFLGDVKGQLEELDQQIKPKAREGSRDGAITEISDEEGYGYTRGGTGYVTKTNVGVAFTGNIRPGITTTGDGTGSGCTVDITVTFGGGTTDYITLTAGGSGYAGIGTNVSTTSSGDGTGCTVNYTGSAGAVTAIIINSPGSGYKSNEVLTISGGGGDATFRLDRVAGAVDRDGIVINKAGTGYLDGDLLYIIGPPGNNDATFTVTQVIDPGQFLKNEVIPSSGPGSPPNLASGLSMLGNLTSSLTSALNFQNIMSNVFPFEIPAKKALTDVYAFGVGGSSLPDGQLPSVKNLAHRALGEVTDVIPKDKIPFVPPGKDELPVNLKKE